MAGSGWSLCTVETIISRWRAAFFGICFGLCDNLELFGFSSSKRELPAMKKRGDITRRSGCSTQEQAPGLWEREVEGRRVF